jgi:hypothetical protein
MPPNQPLELLVHPHLVLGPQRQDGGEHAVVAQGGVVPDEGLVMHEGEEDHDELAVHPVRDPAVSGDDRVEVLDPVGALDGRHEEAPEGRDQGTEDAEDDAVQLDGLDGEGLEGFGLFWGGWVGGGCPQTLRDGAYFGIYTRTRTRTCTSTSTQFMHACMAFRSLSLSPSLPPSVCLCVCVCVLMMYCIYLAVQELGQEVRQLYPRLLGVKLLGDDG